MVRVVAACLALAALLPACGDDPAPAIDIPPWAKVAPEQIEEAEKHGVPVAFENEIGMRFVLIPAGTFMMGSAEDEVGGKLGERQYEATIAEPYYMQITEVTNAEFCRYRPLHDSGQVDGLALNNPRQPVVGVTALDAMTFAAWATGRSSFHSYRLPTEVEWERACRAGSTTRFCFGDDEAELVHYANFGDLSIRTYGRAGFFAVEHLDDGQRSSARVASYLPNAWGIYDMHGNVWEECLFGWSTKIRYDDPICSRGGGWGSPPDSCRCATRLDGRGVMTSSWRGGFRLVAPLPEKDE